MLAIMGYGPNAAAAQWLVEWSAPGQDLIPQVELVIAPPGSQAFAPFGGGYVDDLDDVLADAGSRWRPSGTARAIASDPGHMGRGLPVVSTTVGADGLDAVDGVHLLIGDDAVSFAAAIVRVLEDPTLAAGLGSAGRELVTAHSLRPRVVADVQEWLRSTLEAGAPPRGSVMTFVLVGTPAGGGVVRTTTSTGSWTSSAVSPSSVGASRSSPSPTGS